MSIIVLYILFEGLLTESILAKWNWNVNNIILNSFLPKSSQKLVKWTGNISSQCFLFIWDIETGFFFTWLTIKVTAPTDHFPDDCQTLQSYCPLCMKCLLSLLLWNHKIKIFETFPNVQFTKRLFPSLFIPKAPSSSFCPWEFLTLVKRIFFLHYRTTWDLNIYLGQYKWHKTQRSSLLKKVCLIMSFSFFV